MRLVLLAMNEALFYTISNIFFSLFSFFPHLTVTFFKLIFCAEMVTQICGFTNQYVEAMRELHPRSYMYWQDLTPEEFYKFIGLLLYMGIVQAPNVDLYWSTKQLFHGLWARAFKSRYRYKHSSKFQTTPQKDKTIGLVKLDLFMISSEVNVGSISN